MKSFFLYSSLIVAIPSMWFAPQSKRPTKPSAFTRYVRFIGKNRPLSEDAALRKLNDVLMISSGVKQRGNSYRLILTKPNGFIFAKNIHVTKILYLGGSGGDIHAVYFYVAANPCFSTTDVFKSFGDFPRQDRLTDFSSINVYVRQFKWGRYEVNVNKQGPQCARMFAVVINNSQTKPAPVRGRSPSTAGNSSP